MASVSFERRMQHENGFLRFQDMYQKFRFTLFKATTNGVFFSLKIWIDSMVCGSRPCIISMTKIARSQSDEPRERNDLNDSWPGVSIIRKPGSLMTFLKIWRHIFVRSWIVSNGTLVAPICCVIPPTSSSCTRVFLRLSNSFVLPVSTWPNTQITGSRKYSTDRSFSYSSWHF